MNASKSKTTIFGPMSSRSIVFARVVLVKISFNSVGTKRPSTHLCKFILALVLPDDDIAKSAVTVEGDRADRHLNSLRFFVAVHYSFAKDDGF